MTFKRDVFYVALQSRAELTRSYFLIRRIRSNVSPSFNSTSYQLPPSREHLPYDFSSSRHL